MYFCASDTEPENFADASAGTMVLAATGGARLGSGSAVCFGLAGGARGGCEEAVLSGAGARGAGTSAGGVLSAVALLSGVALFAEFAGTGVVSGEIELGGAGDGVGAVPAELSGALESVGAEGWVAAAGLPILERREPSAIDGFFQRMYPRPAATASTAMMTSIVQALLRGGSSSSSR